jgi:hypothetical protein
MSEAQRRRQAAYHDAKVSAIRKSADQIYDSLETMRTSAIAIAVLYRASARIPSPVLKSLAVAAIVYEALELAVTPAKIITELTNIQANLNNFDMANLEQQAQVRDALDKIADPLSAALDLIDEAIDTRYGKNYNLHKGVEEVRTALKDLSRDLNRDPAKIQFSLYKLVRAFERLVEEIKKQITEPAPTKPEKDAPVDTGPDSPQVGRNPGGGFRGGQYPTADAFF